MSTSLLPHWIEPYRLAAREEHLEGVLPLDGFVRLAEAVGSQSGNCHVWLDFGIDAQGRRQIRGQLEASLQLPCRRCLSRIETSMQSEFLLGMVSSAALAAELPSTHEPVLVEDEQLNLLEMVEDELILSLPQVIYHDEADCHVSRDQLTSGVEDASSPTPPESPFEVLKRLKDKP